MGAWAITSATPCARPLSRRSRTRSERSSGSSRRALGWGGRLPRYPIELRMQLPLLRGVVLKGFSVWLFGRVVVGLGSAAVDGSHDLLRAPLTLPQVVLLGTMGMAAILLDARRRGELLFLRNLGISPVQVGMLAVAPLLLCEFLLRLLVGR